jgi:hypothetical protein
VFYEASGCARVFVGGVLLVENAILFAAEACASEEVFTAMAVVAIK